jgi:hypothetical protein
MFNSTIYILAYRLVCKSGNTTGWFHEYHRNIESVITKKDELAADDWEWFEKMIDSKDKIETVEWKIAIYTFKDVIEANV